MDNNQNLEDEELKYKLFYNWLKDNQVEHNELFIRQFEEDGIRGLASKKSLQPGECLIRVPSHMVLTPKNLKTHPLKELFETLIPDAWSGLVILLMYEKANPRSFFTPWFNIFPSYYETPDSTWDPKILELVRGTDLYKLAKEWRDIKITGYQALEPLFINYPNFFDRKIHTFELFCWAANSVRSRGFEIAPKTPALIPLADMFNVKDFDIPQEPLSTTKLENRHFELFNNYSIFAGEQIYISYGQKSNTDFLLHYGIIIYNNPFDVVKLSVYPTLDTNIPHLIPKFKQELGIIDLDSYEFKLTMDPLPTREHLFVKFCDILARYSNHSTVYYIEKIINIAIDNCMKPISSIPKDLEDDEDAQSAIWYVKSQKKVLFLWKTHVVCLFNDLMKQQKLI